MKKRIVNIILIFVIIASITEQTVHTKNNLTIHNNKQIGERSGAPPNINNKT